MEFTSKPVTVTAARIATVSARDEAGRTPVTLEPDGVDLILPQMLPQPDYQVRPGDYLVGGEKKTLVPKLVFEDLHNIPESMRAPVEKPRQIVAEIVPEPKVLRMSPEGEVSTVPGPFGLRAVGARPRLEVPIRPAEKETGEPPEEMKGA